MQGKDLKGGAARELCSSANLFHYSDMPTHEYRRRHSICDYYYGTDRLPPHVCDIDGQELLLPPRIASGADSLVYLSAMCYDGGPGRGGFGSLHAEQAEQLRTSAAALAEQARLEDCPSRASAAARALSLAQEIEGIDDVLAQHNGAPMGGAQKRRELLCTLADKQMRRERAIVVDILTRQAEAIWGVALPSER